MNVEQVVTCIIAVVGVALVFKFVKGTIKAVISIAIAVIAAILVARFGGIEGIKDEAVGYTESKVIEYQVDDVE